MKSFKSNFTSPFSSPSCGLKVFFFILTILISSNVNSQSNTFERTYGLGFAENSRFTVQTQSGDFITGGFQVRGILNEFGFLLVTDSNGISKKSKILGDSGGITSLNDGIMINDSTIAIIGESSSFSSSSQLALWHYNVYSDSISTWLLGDSSIESGTSLDTVGAMAQKGYILCGSKGNPSNLVFDVWIVRIDAQGNELWNRTLQGPNNDVAWAVRSTSDNGFIVTGQSFSNSTNHGPTAFLWKLDSLGNTTWLKYYGSESYLGYGFDVIEKPDGGYLMCGITGFFDMPRNLWLNVPYIISTNSIGDTIWTWKNNYPREGILRSMVLKGNSVWLTGDWLTWGNDYKMLAMEFNLITNSASYTTFPGSGQDISKTSDGGFVLTGVRLETSPSLLYLVKTDSNGCIQPGCMQAVSVQEHLQANIALKIYPNPVVDQLNIESSFEQGQLQLQIRDMQGRVVHSEQQPAYTNIQLPLSHLPAGMYLLRIQNGQQLAWARLVKQ